MQLEVKKSEVCIVIKKGIQQKVDYGMSNDQNGTNINLQYC